MIVHTPGHLYELQNFESPKAGCDVSRGLSKEAYELCVLIDTLPASELATKLSIAASHLSHSIAVRQSGNQTLQFIEKVPVEGGLPGELQTINNGTTNEELLRVLIDRMGHLQAKFPCRENAIVTTKLEESLMWLEKRTKDRNARGVEGKHLA
jgi:hypothetical protein